MSQIYSKIIGTGHYLPKNVVSNADMEQLCDTSDEWIRSRSGIERRHFCGDNEGNLDMSEQSARLAMEAAGVNPSDIDLIIVGTCTGDYRSPAVANMLQARLGCRNIMAFDVSAACTGFLYSWNICDQFIKNGTVKTALVLGSERISKLIDYNDRSTAVLFGDGSGAAVIQASSEPGYIDGQLHSDGDKAGILFLGNGTPVYEPADRANKVFMNGPEVFKAAVTGMSRAIEETLARNGVDKSEIDWLIPHQANLRIINAIGKKLNMREDQVIITVNETANTSASTIPIALDIAIRDGRVKPGQLVISAAFGAGLTWGTALYRI